MYLLIIQNDMKTMCLRFREREREREREHTRCTLDTLIIEQYNPGEREEKHIIYTKHLPTRGQSFIHPTLAREDVFSTERMRGSAISEYVVSHTLGTYMLLYSSLLLLFFDQWSSGQRLMSRMPQARLSVRVVTCLKCLGNSLHFRPLLFMT